MWIWRDGKVVDKQQLLEKAKLTVIEGPGDAPKKLTEQHLQDMMYQPFHSLYRFLYFLNSPAMTQLKVEPMSEAKSVEWVLARTHYLLLPSKQANTLATTRRGVCEHDIKRAAHWRKAHWRRLSSECWTKKRGLKVPVRHAWVGPKEWVGLDRKIYKVVEPKKKQTCE